MYVCMYVRTYVRMLYVWMYVCMYACMDVCMDGCMYVCLCACIYPRGYKALTDRTYRRFNEASTGVDRLPLITDRDKDGGELLLSNLPWQIPWIPVIAGVLRFGFNETDLCLPKSFRLWLFYKRACLWWAVYDDSSTKRPPSNFSWKEWNFFPVPVFHFRRDMILAVNNDVKTHSLPPSLVVYLLVGENVVKNQSFPVSVPWGFSNNFSLSIQQQYE